MIDGTFTVRPGNKDFVFVRIDNGRIFKISNRSMMNNRSIPKAVEYPLHTLLNLMLDLELNHQ